MPPRRLLLWLCLAVVVLRLTYVRHPLRTDEGGYLLIARQWHSGGEFLYGDYYVDRPPLLMLIFRLAALSDWDAMIRVVVIPFAVLFVVAAWRTGEALSGRVGAMWSAVVGAALMCSPAISADQADGELFAATLVMSSIALALTAWRSDAAGRRLALAAAAGVLAGAAPLVKQNFLDALLFVAVLVLASTLAARRVGRRELAVGLGVLVGSLVPHALVLAWMTSTGVEAWSMWRDLVTFRGRALDVIWAGSLHAPVVRGVALVALGLVSGVLLVVACWVAAARPWRLRGSPEQWATTVVLAFGLGAIAAGGSYWPHYLVQLAPGAVLAVGAVAPTDVRAGQWMRRAGATVAAAAVVGTILLSVVYVTSPVGWVQQRAGEWLAASSLPGDTGFVAYGNAAILETADLGSPYPHLWSLPMRTLDPEQDRLRATLAGPDAPTWVVQVNGLNSWDIDAGSRLRDLVEERYLVAAEICGNPVWLRKDRVRPLAPPPQC